MKEVNGRANDERKKRVKQFRMTIVNKYERKCKGEER